MRPLKAKAVQLPRACPEQKQTEKKSIEFSTEILTNRHGSCKKSFFLKEKKKEKKKREGSVVGTLLQAWLAVPSSYIDSTES